MKIKSFNEFINEGEVNELNSLRTKIDRAKEHFLNGTIEP